jgi:hypothetical protein
MSIYFKYFIEAKCKMIFQALCEMIVLALFVFMRGLQVDFFFGGGFSFNIPCVDRGKCICAGCPVCNDGHGFGSAPLTLACQGGCRHLTKI